MNSEVKTITANPESDKLSFRIPRPATNQRQTITLVPNFAEDHPKSQIQRNKDGSPGEYKVVFFLSTPGKDCIFDSVDKDSIENDIETLVSLKSDMETEATINFEKYSIKAKISFFKNSRNFLSTAIVHLESTSFDRAIEMSYNSLMPIISSWSFYLDIPLDVVGWEATELRTDTRKISLRLLARPKQYDISSEQFIPAEMKPLFSAYREALNSTNPFYQLLSYYKVVEGAYKTRSQRVKKGIIQPQSFSSERFPKVLSELTSVEKMDWPCFESYLGQKYSAARDILRNVLRNAIAHLDIENNVLDQDTYADIARIERTIPVVKYLARELLKNEIKCVPELASVKVE